MRTVCIIPARGGSKRIPHKNIADFCGQPMLAWTIDAAIQSHLGDVYVSTDDDAIAQVARDYGAHVIRRESCNDDHSTVSDATIATLRQLERRGYTYDTVVQLMANCPLRTSLDIKTVYESYIQQRVPSCISVFKYGWMNPWWALKCAGQPLFPNAIKTRSQDLPDLYCPTGAVWVASTMALLTYGTFYAGFYGICEIPWQSAVDIDEPEDLAFAKAVKMMEVSE